MLIFNSSGNKAKSACPKYLFKSAESNPSEINLSFKKLKSTFCSRFPMSLLNAGNRKIAEILITAKIFIINRIRIFIFCIFWFYRLPKLKFLFNRCKRIPLNINSTAGIQKYPLNESTMKNSKNITERTIFAQANFLIVWNIFLRLSLKWAYITF